MSDKFDFKFELGENELARLVEILPNEGVVVLRGDLASGKTTLVKAIVAARGKSAPVTSPTFSLMHDYGRIYHYDLYRAGFDEIVQNGLIENFFEEGLHLVEWGDERLIKWLAKYEIPVLVVSISGAGEKRTYEVKNA